MQRIAIGILITAGNSTYISGILSVLIIIGGIVITVWKKPFIHYF
jgi:hypothetical protein